MIVMYRYMVFMWNRTDREANHVAKFLAAKLHEDSPHAWSQGWDGGGLTIYHAGEHKGRMQTYRLTNKRGAVLGRLFRNDYTSVVEDLSDVESRKCLESRGQRLIDEYWGRYVAFLNDPATETRYIIRDPSGAFPCYHTRFEGVTIYFSDMQDAASFPFLKFTVNWDYVKSNIMLPSYQKINTGLNEVGEVLPAECREISPFKEKSRFLWNPNTISESNVVEDPELATELLRHTVENTIAALSGCYDRVIHNLGGLDSSIVLACMAKQPNRPIITCVNNYTNSLRGDERHYSRQVAERFDVPLEEFELDYRKVDLKRVYESNQLANPLSVFDCVGLTGDVLRLAKKQSSEALFYGTGGDNVFFQPARNIGALDYVRSHGFGAGALKVALASSRYGQTSLFSTFREMLRERFNPAPCYKYVRDTLFANFKVPLVNTECVDMEGHEKYLHPLLLPDDSSPKGKYLHILMCALYSNEYYDHLDTDYHCEKVRTYLSQPIIEACLRIPIWILTYGGVDRGLARKAFQHDLPREIVIRRSKSTPEELYDRIYDNNIDLLREHLLDGYMVKYGLLHRGRLESALNSNDPNFNVLKFQTLGFLATEIWLRRWEDRPSRDFRNSLAVGNGPTPRPTHV